MWRSRLAFAGAIGCLVIVALAGAFDPATLLDTPLLVAAAFCAFEAGLALLNLRAEAGRPAPKWLL